MDKNVEKPVDPRAATRAGAQSAASSPALAARVRELETVLAVERAENAKRLREVDGHMRVMRASLGELQADFRRLSDEREQLRAVVAERDRKVSELTAQLDQTRSRIHDEAAEREGAAARAVSAAIERAQAAEIQLNAARSRVEALEDQLLEARSEGEVAVDQRIRELERRVSEREVQLIRAADMLDRYEGRLARSEERADSAARVAQALSRDAARPAHTPVEVTPAPPVSSVVATAASPAPVAAPPPPAAAQARPAAADPGGASEAESDTYEPGPDAVVRARGVFTKATGSAAPRAGRRRRRRSGSGSGSGSTGGSESVDDLLLDDTRDELPVVHRSGGRACEDDSEEEPAPRLDSPSRVNERQSDAAPSADRLPDIEGVEIEQEVSATPAGRVFFGRVLRTRRPVLVQLLPGRLAELDEGALRRLMTARHPHLVAALSYGESSAGPFVVVERPDGDDADRLVRRGGALLEEQALAMVRQTARGLAYAAGQGFLHGDLRPWSLRVGHGSHVQVLGVGTTVIAGPHRRPAANPEFAAPERLHADGVVDGRSDIFSLGAMLYYLLTGRAPFEGAPEDVARRDPNAACPDPRTANPGVSAHAAGLVAHLAHPDAASRPATWEAVLAALESPADGPHADPATALLERVKAWFVANPLVAVTAALLPLVAIVVMFVVMGPTEPTARERFETAAVRAQSLAATGDMDAARQVYAAFLTGTGDPDVEREAASRIDSLYR